MEEMYSDVFGWGIRRYCCHGPPMWVMDVDCDSRYGLELGGVSGGGGVGLGIALGVVFVLVGWLLGRG